jgi:hypothetical protein
MNGKNCSMSTSLLCRKPLLSAQDRVGSLSIDPARPPGALEQTGTREKIAGRSAVVLPKTAPALAAAAVALPPDRLSAQLMFWHEGVSHYESPLND